MNAEMDFITIAEVAQLIAARELSPVELTKAKLARRGRSRTSDGGNGL